MTKYLNRIRIDTHGDEDPWTTEITDVESGTRIEPWDRIDITIKDCEPASATLNLLHMNAGPQDRDGQKAMRVYVTQEQAHCPDVDLAPLVALISRAECGKYYLDGNSWEYLPDGSLQVIFRKVETLS